MEFYAIPPPPGSLVWERDPDPLGDPGPSRRLRGGTLVCWDGGAPSEGAEHASVVVISGTPMRTRGRRQVLEVVTSTLPLCEVDPVCSVPADARSVERSIMARRLFAALGARTGAPTEADRQWLAWAEWMWARRPHWPNLEPEDYRGGLVVADMPTAYEGARS